MKTEKQDIIVVQSAEPSELEEEWLILIGIRSNEAY